MIRNHILNYAGKDYAVVERNIVEGRLVLMLLKEEYVEHFYEYGESSTRIGIDWNVYKTYDDIETVHVIHKVTGEGIGYYNVVVTDPELKKAGV